MSDQSTAFIVDDDDDLRGRSAGSWAWSRCGRRPIAEPSQEIALDTGASLTDTDRLESLSITISGVPGGATLSTGSNNGDGSWTLTQAQLAGLTIKPPAGSGADFTLTVTATSTEAANGNTV